jgi:hypothetical protein
MSLRARVALAGLVLAAVSMLLSAWLYTRSADAIGRIEAERMERTDQSRLLNERKQAEDIRALRPTYR